MVETPLNAPDFPARRRLIERCSQDLRRTPSAIGFAPATLRFFNTDPQLGRPPTEIELSTGRALSSAMVGQGDSAVSAR